MLAQFTKIAKKQSSIAKYELMTLTNNLNVLWFSECLPIFILHIFTKSEVSVIKRRRKSQKGWPLTVGLKDHYVASFPCYPFQYEVRSLNTTKIQSYNTSKNIPYVSHSDIDPGIIDMFLYAIRLFVIVNQYHYVIQPGRLNYGTIRTCLRKGLWISIGDDEGKTKQE